MKHKNESQNNDPKNPRRRWLPRLRIWHLFIVIALAAWYAPRMTILGNCPADIVIEKMAINHDENWGKYWATFDSRFVGPGFLEDERLDCFIEVPESFTFGDKYKIGDHLRFRYQYRDVGSWKKEDPRQKVIKKFFGINVMGSDDDPGLMYHVGELD